MIIMFTLLYRAASFLRN